MNRLNITEILLKVALNTITPKPLYYRDIVIDDIVVQIDLISVNCCVIGCRWRVRYKRGYEGYAT